MGSDDLLEQALKKLKTILQEVDEIDTCIDNDKRSEIHLRAIRIRNNADDIKDIFNKLKNS